MSTEPVSALDFHALGLSPASLRAVTAAGFTTPTPIQAQAIPPALTGSDVIGCAATGTGKTAAYLLPVLERLAGKTGTRALVLAPTRELALQIAQAVDTLGREARMRAAVVIGGVAQEGQRKALRERRPILVATPDGWSTTSSPGTARLDDIEILVLDEADRMLDMGFAPQLAGSWRACRRSARRCSSPPPWPARSPSSRRSTCARRSGWRWPAAGPSPRGPSSSSTGSGQNEKNALLESILRGSDDSTLVFVRTTRRADKVAPLAGADAGHRSTGSTRDRSQAQRQRALEASAAASSGCWWRPTSPPAASTSRTSATSSTTTCPTSPRTTSTASDAPLAPQASGRASSFVAPDEAPLLQAIERLMRTRVPEGRVPRDEPGFKAAVESSVSQQRDPGPRQRGHGVSSRPAGQAPGRHARSHGTGAAFSGRPSRNGPSRRPAAASRW